jgi:hypothetical protein
MNPIEKVGKFVRSTGRDEDGDATSQYFGGLIPVELFGRLIPEDDRAVERLANDGILGRCNQGRKEGLGFQPFHSGLYGTQ